MLILTNQEIEIVLHIRRNYMEQLRKCPENFTPGFEKFMNIVGDAINIAISQLVGPQNEPIENSDENY